MSKNRQAEVVAAQKDIDFTKNAYQIELDTTMGKILLNLFPDVAPGHCKNMLGLAKIGYYDGVIVHRIVRDFVIQAGCPEGTGYGGPGYTIKAEFNTFKHEPGVLSMARSTDPHSAGSQFFLCLGRLTNLDNLYTVFGKTADEASLKNVLAIGRVPVGAGDKPSTPVTIKTATVIVKPLD